MSIDIHYPCHVLHEGYTVLVAERDCAVTGMGREGLFDYDTRILSRHRLTLNGQSLRYVAGKPLDACRWEAHLVLERDGGSAASTKTGKGAAWIRSNPPSARSSGPTRSPAPASTTRSWSPSVIRFASASASA